ncbi:MAG: hypothetical protein AAGU14_10860 [Eubacteriaceae bacterium]
MKQAILPIGIAILMVVFTRNVNPIVEIGGIIMAALIGLGIGVALNSLVMKIIKSSKKEEAETEAKK